MDSLIDVIREKRERMGLTQLTLGRKVGVGRMSISRLEVGNPGVSWGLVMRVLQVLEIDTCYFDKGREVYVLDKVVNRGAVPERRGDLIKKD